MSATSSSLATLEERISKRVVSVRSVPGDDDLTVSLEVDSKVRQLNRCKLDTVGKTLNRILLNVVREKIPRALRKRISSSSSDGCGASNGDPEIRLLHAGVPLADDTTNIEGWKDGNLLLIGDVPLSIVVNPPTVLKLSLPDNIMVGFPIFPLVKYEFGSTKYSTFTWYKMATPPSGIDLNTKEFLERELTWEKIGQGFTFTPDVSLIRYKIKCDCQPGNESGLGPFVESFVSDSVVTAGPGQTISDTRTMYTQRYLGESNQIRVVTYNILADVFADNEFARSTFFPYCPQYAIDFFYRRQLILKELLQYHADIICLQECELKMFDSYLKPAFDANGHHGYLCLKLGEMPEGEALFIRDRKFRPVQDYSISVRDALDLPCNRELRERLAYFPEYLADLRKRTAVAQVHLLQEKLGSMRYLCVVNTHLYYKPDSSDVRLLQIAAICTYVSFVLGELSEVVSVILCGDLNSTEGTPALEYLSGAAITEDHAVWSLPRCATVGFRCSLKNPLSLLNASGFPPYTNYTPSFQETLDYIFASKSDFQVTSFVPIPNRDEIEIYVALPNVVAPSDHLALVLELDWSPS